MSPQRMLQIYSMEYTRWQSGWAHKQAGAEKLLCDEKWTYEVRLFMHDISNDDVFTGPEDVEAWVLLETAEAWVLLEMAEAWVLLRR